MFVLIDQAIGKDTFEERALKQQVLLNPGALSASAKNVAHNILNDRFVELPKAMSRLEAMSNGDFRVFRLLGKLASIAGCWDIVARAACRGMLLKPELADFYEFMMRCYGRVEKVDDFEGIARQAGVLDVDPGLIYQVLALEADAARDFPRSERNFRRALVVSPEGRGANQAFLRVLNGNHNFVSGRRQFRKASVVWPGDSKIWRAGANIAANLMQRDLFRRCIDKAQSIEESGAGSASFRIVIEDHVGDLGFAGEQELRRAWWSKYGESERPPAFFGRRQKRLSDTRISVGYVSADFRAHSAGLIFSTVLQHHDRGAFDIYLYSNSPRCDTITESLRKQATGWREIGGLSDGQVSDLVCQDGVDILVDLSGHSPGNRLPLFALKPAPLQITAWGYAHGTGLRTVDYLVADPVSVPTAERRWFSETVLDLPCIIPCPLMVDYPPVAPLPALTSGHVTFGSLNRWLKVTDRTLALWTKVLAAVPDARLLLKNEALSHRGNRDLLIGRFADLGVSADRLILEGATIRYEHLATYNRVDICLDTLPQTGGMTTWEACQMGVPVVTRTGSGVAHRISHSVLNCIGLMPCVANDDREFVDVAAGLASDLPALAELRNGLRRRVETSLGGDGATYVRALEDRYRAIWHRWCETEAGNERR